MIRFILVSSAAIILIISIAATFVFYMFQNNAAEDIVKKTEQGTTENSVKNFNNSVNNLCSISSYFSTYQSIPLRYIDPTTQVWITNSINNQLNSYMVNYRFIKSISVTIDGIEISNGTVESGEKELLDTFLEQKIYRYKTPSGYPNYLCFENTNNSFTKNPTKIIANLQKICDAVFTEESEHHIEYVVNSNGKIILSNNVAAIFTDIPDRIGDYSTNAFYTTYGKNGKEFITVRKIADNCPFTYISVCNYAYYSKILRTSMLTSIFFGIALFIILLLTTFLIVHYTYRPIKTISTVLYSYYPDIDINTDEITFLVNSISKNISDKQNIEKEMEQTLKKLNYAQIKALQSQLNPHFLFNTLENIKGMSVRQYGVDNKIEQSIILLDKIIFESINQKNILTSVKNEIEISKCYISLMQLRSGDKFTVNWDVDTILLNASIIRFTLQPLIENSIQKGFKDKTRNCTINIDVKTDGEFMLISVSDNGSGIEKSKLEILKNTIQDINTVPDRHVGLHNLNSRIKFLYSNDFGITDIKSSTEGTTVFIKYPLKFF